MWNVEKVQDAHLETHVNMCQGPGLVCGYRPEGRLLPCLDLSKAQAVSPVGL